jgi:uridine kinase
MISDRLLITEKSKNNAKIILNKLKDERIILLYGNSGTQKSETADCLQELLFKQKYQSVTLSLDDFYLIHPTIRNLNRKKLGIDSVGLSEIDWEELKRICEDFLLSKPIRIKRTHKYADIIEHVTLPTEDISFLIIEGLYSGYLKKYNCGDYAVYLEGNPQQTLEFRKKRGKEKEDDSFRQEVVQKEFNVVCQLKRYADLLIPFEMEKENETKS